MLSNAFNVSRSLFLAFLVAGLVQCVRHAVPCENLGCKILSVCFHPNKKRLQCYYNSPIVLLAAFVASGGEDVFGERRGSSVARHDHMPPAGGLFAQSSSSIHAC